MKTSARQASAVRLRSALAYWQAKLNAATAAGDRQSVQDYAAESVAVLWLRLEAL